MQLYVQAICKTTANVL